MPWQPRYSEPELRAALEGARTWREVIERLELTYHGKTIATIRKWAGRWGLSVDHLTTLRRGLKPRYSDAELERAISASRSWAETARRLGYSPSGGNWRTLRRKTRELGISTAHFDPHATNRERARRAIPLEMVFVEGSKHGRGLVKRRLFEYGLKQHVCELCGQDENWRGRRISLILDHINGIGNDNRLENLRIVCPNCAAGLETHCGRKNRIEREPRECKRCGRRFEPKYADHRYCSQACGTRWKRPNRRDAA